MKIRVFTRSGSFVIDEISDSLRKRIQRGDKVFYPWYGHEELTAYIDGNGNITKIWSDDDQMSYTIKGWEIIEADDEERELFLKFLFDGKDVCNYDKIDSSDDLDRVKFCRRR